MADTSLFGTLKDDTNVGAGKYYKTENNLPWAMNITTQFKYPIEKEDITGAYLNFANWALSNGINFSDWYINEDAGYRNNAVIFNNN